jgi:hypothetical protein
MGGRGDLGLVMTARVLPCAIFLFTRYTDQELARHRGVLNRLASGAGLTDDEVEDSVGEGVNGLLGLAILGVLGCAASIWLSQHVSALPFSVLTGVCSGLFTAAGALATIYSARMMWRRPSLTPRQSDFWVAMACGLLAGALVTAARLAAIQP